jgi:hypothetical protein
MSVFDPLVHAASHIVLTYKDGCLSNFINQKSVNAAQFIYGFRMKLPEI